jgi:hypothetical protein
MRARPWVSGRNFANQVSPVGRASIGKSAPARNHGRIAMAGTRAMYSSCLGTRLARISAMPYMPTVKSVAAPMNQPIPLTDGLKSIPRATAAGGFRELQGPQASQLLSVRGQPVPLPLGFLPDGPAPRRSFSAFQSSKVATIGPWSL